MTKQIPTRYFFSFLLGPERDLLVLAKENIVPLYSSLFTSPSDEDRKGEPSQKTQRKYLIHCQIDFKIIL